VLFILGDDLVQDGGQWEGDDDDALGDNINEGD
jgi:hypothetical protein